MVAFSAVSLAVCAAFLLLSRTNPEAKPEEAVARAPSMGSLLRDRKLLLFVVAALGLGFFFLPAFALLLDMCGAVAGEAGQAALFRPAAVAIHDDCDVAGDGGWGRHGLTANGREWTRMM